MTAPAPVPTRSTSDAVPRPLTQWMTGTLTVVLDSGGTYALEASAYEAVQVRKMLDESRSSDVVRWPEAWFNFDPRKVALVRWRPSPDYGWPMAAGTREAQRARGHHGGVIATLVDYFADGPEPAFSTDALWALSDLATQLDPERLMRHAATLQGTDGAAYAAALYAEARQHRAAAATAHRPTASESAADNLVDETAQSMAIPEIDLPVGDDPEPEPESTQSQEEPHYTHPETTSPHDD